MKKKLFGFLLVLTLMLALSTTALASAPAGATEWKVTYTSDGKVESSFKSEDIQLLLEGMEPGDEISMDVNLYNQYKESVDWYMKNTIEKSLEDDKEEAYGGAYTYTLVYKGSDGKTRKLYDSNKVGGQLPNDAPEDTPEGLHGVNDALAEYFFLESMPSKKSGTVTLTVKMEGNSQGNRYQDTDGWLRMRFAAMPTESRTIVKVGDDTNRMPYYVAMGVSGAALLALAIVGTRRRKGKEGTDK